MGAPTHSGTMDRYKITMPDGSSTDELFESDKEAIRCAVEANRGVSANVVVERYTKNGHLIATSRTGASQSTRKTHRARD